MDATVLIVLAAIAAVGVFCIVLALGRHIDDVLQRRHAEWSAHIEPFDPQPPPPDTLTSR